MDPAGPVAFALPVQQPVVPALAAAPAAAPAPVASPASGAGAAARAPPLAAAAALAAAALASAGSRRRTRKGAGRGAGVRRQAAVIEEVDKPTEAKEPDAEAAPPEPPKKKFDARLQPGVGPPLDFWDPAGFCPINDEQNFRKLRAAELKHGRVAMLAAVGQVLPCYVKFPGFFKVPSGVLAVTKAPGSYGMAALVILAGVLEIFFWKERDDREPGDFGDPLGLKSVGGYDEFWREIELNNGRAAMWAAIGIIGAEVVTGRDAQDQLATLADIIPFF